MLAQTIRTTLWYSLLAPVHKPFARVGLALGLTGSGIKTMARLFFVAPLIVLGSVAWLQGFDARQLESIAMVMIRLNAQATNIGVIFMGVGQFFEGLVLLRASWAPRIIAIMTAIAGIMWLVEIYPPLASRFFLPLILFAMLVDIITIVWLFRGLPQTAAVQQG
jgi:Domain of unknown function (DUF4386)